MPEPVKIVLTGAESTGKSTISAKLAGHYQTCWIPEFSREYIENLQRKYTYSDIEYIARHQLKTEAELPQQKLIFFDTWLIITKVWFDFVYGKHPEWLHQAILDSKIDLFLLCDIDMIWENDPVRENGGDNRIKLHQLYINELESYGFQYCMVRGEGENRLKNAIDLIDQFLAAIPSLK